jgi:chaperone BCS1
MDLHSGSPWETLTLTTLSSSRHLLPDLLSEARELAEQGTEGKTVVYTAWGVEWRPFGKPRRRREMGSVVLADGVAERVEADLKGFLGRGKWYAERGTLCISLPAVTCTDKEVYRTGEVISSTAHRDQARPRLSRLSRAPFRTTFACSTSPSGD